MSRPLLLYIDGMNGSHESFASNLGDLFDIYPVNDFESAKKIISEQFAITVCRDLLDDSQASAVFEWLQQKYPSCVRIVLMDSDFTSEGQRLLEKITAHKHIPTDLDQTSLRLHLIEANNLANLLRERNRFQELSITDPVTNLTNHRFFQEKFRLELLRAKRTKSALSLIMIDVDHFKLFNDQFGHPKGDEILATIAKQLKSQLPSKSSLSRYGGEEFAAIIPQATSQQALVIAETLRQSVLRLEARTSISLGIASYPEHGLDADELISISDQALYCAKRQGRNMCIVASDI